MWISKTNDWNESHTDLSKYFIERLKQRVDYEETISNRHRTTNGYTLINEIVEVATLAQKRIKSINRLVSLVNEAKSESISSSIVNDYILSKYHPDIVDYYKNVNVHKLKENGKDLSELLNKSKINSIRLHSEYYSNIKFEISNIDFQSTYFVRISPIVDKLIDCLIPFLLYHGYSITSISDIAYRQIWKKKGKNSPNRIVSSFDGKRKAFVFLLKVPKGHEEINEILSYLTKREVAFEECGYGDVEDLVFEDFFLQEHETIYIINHQTIDPHNYLRNLYELGLKNYVASKDRLSLHYFLNFFDGVFWRFNRPGHKFQRSNMSIDPINVPKRKSTLVDTLITLSPSYELNFSETNTIPHIKQIRDAIYYYHLALGSKSIENSLSLLWTSLETLIPYRLKDNDIENVQYFVSKSLSVGAIGREITSFADRFLKTNRLNDNPFTNLGLYTSYLNFNSEGIRKWIEWLATDYQKTGLADPFGTLKPISNLLCSQFCYLNDIYTGKHSDFNTAQYWLDKINSSEISISYQLDRIYLHRNQIVHSGKFINEYSNLWDHLEWYVGKLLSYCVIDFIKRPDQQSFNKEELFLKLEADADALKNILSINKSKKICDINFAYHLVAKHSWQFF